MGPARRQERPRTRDFAVESLESRRLLAHVFSLLPDPKAFIGPIYVAPPRSPQAASSAMVVRKLISTRSDAISLIDLTLKDNHPQLERGFWASPSVWTTSKVGVFDDSQARVEEIARVVRQGGKDRWRQENVRANAFTMLDFENPYFASRSPEYIAQRLRWFKAAAPDAPLSMYGYAVAPEWTNRERLASVDQAAFAQLKQDLQSRIAVLNEQSVITIECYMLSPAYVDRDLKAIEVYARAMREVCPNKPINALLWGAYHTNWNKPNSVLSDSVMRRYVDLIRTYFDAATVWGPTEDNVKLFSMLADPSNRTRLVAPAFNTARLPTSTLTGTSTGATPVRTEIEL